MNLRTRVSALALAGLLSGALAGCGSSDDTEPTAADPATESPSSEPTSEPTSSDIPSDEPTSDDTGAPGTVTVPLYFGGQTPMGERLYREFRAVESDNPMEEALALLAAGDALDPDYDTVLPPMTIESVTAGDGAITIDLAADSRTSDKSVSPDDAALAVQSLVYTLQGITQTRDPLKITVGGVPTPFFGQPTDTGVEAAKPLDVLALVNITTPESDAEVSGVFTAEGVASSYEANVPWVISAEGGGPVLEGFATAEQAGDQLYPWSTEIDVSDLEPGSYEFAAFTDDPSGGEGPGAFEDTKTITVQ